MTRGDCLPLRSAATAAALVFLMTGSSAARAQGGYTNPYTGTTWNNPISSYLDTVLQNRSQQQMLMNQQFSQMLFNRMITDSVLRKVGRDRIAAGRASTRFTPSARASEVASMVPDGGDPGAKQKAAAANRACLADFHGAMKRFALTPYDVADARALSFVMAYTASKGRDPGAARLRTIRGQFRQAMLKDPMFQAIPDSERQAGYEKMVIPAMLAVTARRQSARPGIAPSQRGVLASMAQRMGDGLLRGLWTKPAEAIELSPTGFVDRGDRLAATGGGKTAFERTAESFVAPVYGSSYSNQSVGRDEAYYRGLLDRFDSSATGWGLRTNDLADANVTAGVLAYRVYTDGKVTLNASQRDWLRKEMRGDILGSPDFQRLTDRQKQEQYEKLALEAAHLAAQREKMKREIAALSRDTGNSFDRIGNASVIAADKRILETNRALAHDLLNRIFAPRRFDAFTLTPNGFRLR